MKLKRITKILIAVCILGLALLLYPQVSNYWNLKTSTKAISTYTNKLETLNENNFEQIWDDAMEYNEDLKQRNNQYILSKELEERYNKLLNLTGNGMMGYIDIPAINVSIPLFHGTSEGVLQRGVGHIEWSSLPIGGIGTHCIISGHRGLPNAKLFTDLDKIREGDIFSISILDETLYYEVDQIRIVEPDYISDLNIIQGMDYVTLVTCTPYGINTHRLLVRGHRIDSTGMGVNVTSEAIMVDQTIVAFYLLVPLLFILVMKIMLKKPKNKVEIKGKTK